MVAVSSSNVTYELAPPGMSDISIGTISFDEISIDEGANGYIVHSPCIPGDSLCPLPSGFTPTDPPIYYDIILANIRARIIATLCLYYPANLDPPRLFHYEDDGWKDVTVSAKR